VLSKNNLYNFHIKIELFQRGRWRKENRNNHIKSIDLVVDIYTYLHIVIFECCIFSIYILYFYFIYLLLSLTTASDSSYFLMTNAIYVKIVSSNIHLVIILIFDFLSYTSSRPWRAIFILRL